MPRKPVRFRLKSGHRRNRRLQISAAADGEPVASGMQEQERACVAAIFSNRQLCDAQITLYLSGTVIRPEVGHKFFYAITFNNYALH